MKIHQLFRQKVETETLIKLLSCFGLIDLEDKKIFSKYDLCQQDTVNQLQDLLPELQSYYLPCKAKIYLDNLTEKKALTVLKQVLRIHGYYLLSKERNMNNKKVILYQLMGERERYSLPMMKMHTITHILNFR